MKRLMKRLSKNTFLIFLLEIKNKKSSPIMLRQINYLNSKNESKNISYESHEYDQSISSSPQK